MIRLQRALFEKSDIHDYRLNDHDFRIKTLEGGGQGGRTLNVINLIAT